MFIQQVRLTVAVDQEDAFEAALLDVRRRAFMAPGFRRFDVAQDTQYPDRYQVQLYWETAEDLSGFSTSTRFGRAWALVQPFLVTPAEFTVLLDRDGLDFQGPGTMSDAVSY